MVSGLAELVATCVLLAAQAHEVPPAILWTLLAVEGGRVGTVSVNTNGTADLGPMQVNTIWVPKVAQETRMAATAVRDRLINDPCFNIGTGAWILAREIRGAGGDFWVGVARYHSRTPNLQQRYTRRVRERAVALFGANALLGRELPRIPPALGTLPVMRPPVTARRREG